MPQAKLHPVPGLWSRRRRQADGVLLHRPPPPPREGGRGCRGGHARLVPGSSECEGSADSGGVPSPRDADAAPRACCRTPSPLEVELGASTRGPAPAAPARGALAGPGAARAAAAPAATDSRCRRAAAARTSAARLVAARPRAPQRRHVEPRASAAAGRLSTSRRGRLRRARRRRPRRGRRERAGAASGKRRPYRGLSTPRARRDLERTLGTRLRPRHATVQKARRGNGDGYEGWLRRHFASPPRRRSKTSPPKVWI